MTRARLLRLAPLLGLAIVLAACTPGVPVPTGSSATPDATGPSESATPTPEPETRPARADLVLTVDGLGTLDFGVAPPTDPALAMLVLEPEWCTDASTGWDVGIGPGDAEAALWVPIADYRDGRGADFGVEVAGGLVTRIDLFGPAIPTQAGIRVGDSRAALEAAYPSAVRVEEYLTDIYVVSGPNGAIQLEVSRQPDDMVYWLPDEVEKVTYIHGVMTGFAPFSVAASENIAGSCPF